MKRILSLFVAAAVLSLLFCGCAIPVDGNIPSGFVSKEEHFEDGFQDYTDYCKYYYPDKSSFEHASHYHQITEADIELVRGYFSNCEAWMATTGRSDEYDFNDACITAGDYVCIKTMEGQHDNLYYGKYDAYTVYFFDVDTCVLYYIHNNN